MRVIGAFLAAVGTAAITFDLEFLFEGLVAGVQMSASIFLVDFALNMMIGLPVALVGGLPIWLILRHRTIRSLQAFALVGASLALVSYLLPVAAGMGQPSDHPMTFAENIGRSFHIPKIVFAMLAGARGLPSCWIVKTPATLRPTMS